MPRIRKSALTPKPAPSFSLDYAPANGVLPPVLTPAAVVAKAIPPLGASGLPTSLEADVPGRFRYWKAADLETAMRVRDELVESGTITARNVLMVDGVVRAVVWKAFLSEDDADASLAERTPPEIAGALQCADGPDGTQLHVAWFDGESVAAAFGELGTPAVLAMKSSTATRDAALQIEGVTVFDLETRPGVIYATTASLLPTSAARVHQREEMAKRHVRLMKAEDVAEERFVLGVVLEPDTADSQGDIYNELEVRKAAHWWMENQGQLGRQHEEIVTGKIKVIETYLAPADFAVGEETVKKGTWLMGVRVADDALWSGVKSGAYTGFSIGGTAMRKPLQGGEQ